jgi:hypothetical protein
MIVFIAVQLVNAPALISTNVPGSLTVVSFVHPANAFAPRTAIFVCKLVLCFILGNIPDICRLFPDSL